MAGPYHELRDGASMRVARENEITEEHEALQPAGAPAPPPTAPGPVRDVWPWLALLGGLAAAALLVWLLVLSQDGGGRTVVPSVVGLQQRQAVARLTRAGYGVRAVVGPSGRPRGVVAAQRPGGGSQLDRGRAVVLDVSNGRALRTATTTTPAKATKAPVSRKQKPGAKVPPTTAAVPSVMGQAAAAGAGAVESAGFAAETDPVDAAAPAGSIVQQDPAAGTQAAAGGVVRLAVAVGPQRPARRVPGVVGKPAAAARAALLDAHLTVKTERRRGRLGVVLSQSPAAGTSVPAYTQVSLAVGSG